jgi:hypothetical protein
MKSAPPDREYTHVVDRQHVVALRLCWSSRCRIDR